MNDDSIGNLIDRVERRIHRIRLYIHPALYRPLFRVFRGSFQYLGRNKTSEKNLIDFRFRTGPSTDVNALSVQCLLKQDSYPTFFLSIRNPRIPFQKDLLGIIESEISKNDFLRGTDPNNACCVFEVESPLDFHPKEPANLDRLFTYLATGLFFRKGRRGEHLVFQIGHRKGRKKTHACPTLYIGKRLIDPQDPDSLEWKIDVHNPLHGLRLYYRPIDERPRYIRLEYVAYKRRLIALGLRGLKDLPKISAERIRPLDYVLYRKKGGRNLHTVVMNKLRPRSERRLRLLSSLILHINKSLVWSGLYHTPKKPDEAMRLRRKRLSDRTARYPYTLLEIVAEVDAFKQIKERYGIEYSVGDFYPVDKSKLRHLKSLVP